MTGAPAPGQIARRDGVLSDYLDPLFLPRLVADIKRQAPLARVEVHALTREADYRAQLALGEIDLVIGNWLQPPDELHMARLFSDEVVCLVSREHPAVRRGRAMAEPAHFRGNLHAPAREQKASRRDRPTVERRAPGAGQ